MFGKLKSFTGGSGGGSDGTDWSSEFDWSAGNGVSEGGSGSGGFNIKGKKDFSKQLILLDMPH